MNNVEKLKTCKPLTFVLNRRDDEWEPANKTLERFRAGEANPEDQARVQEQCSRLLSVLEKMKADEQGFLQENGLPPDITRAVRLVMADMFGEFVSADEIDGFALDKVLELLQTAVDKRHYETPKEAGRDKPGPEFNKRSNTIAGYFKMWEFLQKTGNAEKSDVEVSRRTGVNKDRVKILREKTRPPTPQEIEEHRTTAKKR